MASPPSWVKALKPAGPQGSELIQQERNRSNLNVDQLSHFLFTRDALERKHRILAVLQQEKVFDKSQ
ncbi:hypothetical protein KC343_g902, partial [Hortaea werneckii]